MKKKNTIIISSFIFYLSAVICLLIYCFTSAGSVHAAAGIMVTICIFIGAVLSGIANIICILDKPEKEVIGKEELHQLEKEMKICYHDKNK